MMGIHGQTHANFCKLRVGAHRLVDLRSPPGNRLEPLKGDLLGFHSIRVNDQWRVIFRWIDGNALDVSLVEYH